MGQPLARPGGTLKGEDDRRFGLYTVIRIKIRFRVSIAREIGFRFSIAAAGRFAARPYYKAPKPYSPCYSHTLDPIFIQTTARAARARRGEDGTMRPPLRTPSWQGLLELIKNLIFWIIMKNYFFQKTRNPKKSNFMVT